MVLFSLSPALAVIAKMLGMSESLAGITLLAFGNGSPDIFASLAHIGGDSELMYAELIGAAAFVTAFIAGIIVLVRPFKLIRRNHIRDVAFFLTAIVIIDGFMNDGVYTLWEGIVTVMIYVAYLVFVLFEHIKIKRKVKQVRSSISEHVQMGIVTPPEVLRAVDVLEKTTEISIFDRRDSSIVLDEEVSRVFEEGINRTPNEGFWKDLALSVIPIDMIDWKNASRLGQLLLVLKVSRNFLIIFAKLIELHFRRRSCSFCCSSFPSSTSAKSCTGGRKP